MKHSKSLVTIAEALKRVFIPPLQPLRISSLCVARYPWLVSPQCHLHSHTPFCQPQQRYYAFMRGSDVPVNSRIPGDEGERSRHRLPNRPPRDEEIRAYRVVIKKDGKLSLPVSLVNILDTRERDEKGRHTQFLQEIAPASLEHDRPYPICIMFDKKLVREKEIAQRKLKKEQKKQEKQLEVNWTINENDLGHRLEKLKAFLEKGYRVEIIFGAQRKGWMQRRQATQQEIKAVIEKIVGVVKEVEGSREWKPMSGKLGEQAILAFEGKAKKP